MVSLFGDLIEMLGINTAARIIRHFGGERIYIPKYGVCPQHRLLVLGKERVARLVAAFGAETLEVPNLSVCRRRRKILRAMRSGESRRSIRAKFDVTSGYLRYLSRRFPCKNTKNIQAKSSPRLRESVSRSPSNNAGSVPQGTTVCSRVKVRSLSPEVGRPRMTPELKNDFYL